ncbi:MAG: hypothetical protein Q7T68_06595 [Sphingopyxis sp.]|nr:hypothetical protein [Sphingopyxis sp.]
MMDDNPDNRIARSETVHALAAIEQRIEHRTNAHNRLTEAFNALADSIRTALADGRSPLAQIGELDELTHQIHQLECILTEDLESATKQISALAGPV